MEVESPVIETPSPVETKGLENTPEKVWYAMSFFESIFSLVN